MKGSIALTALSALSSVAVTGASTLVRRDQPKADVPLTISGNAIYRDNARFYIIGVTYQPGGSSKEADPLTDSAGCKRDVELFKELGINTIRTYITDNTGNHDDCMQMLSDAGIYVIFSLSTSKYSINRNDPATSFTAPLLQNAFATLDTMSKYKNAAIAMSNNEGINSDNTTSCAPYIKAENAYARQYSNARGYHFLIGPSAADVDSNRYEFADYMNCGANYTRSDFFSFNDYSWCDPSTFEKAGWDNKIKKLQNYGRPIFLSEFGCNTNKREFNELAALYSTKMSGVYSGGLVYEFTQEDSNYGLVKLNGNDVEKLPDFDTLKDKIAELKKNNLPPSDAGGAKTTDNASTCPAQSKSWDVKDEQLPNIPDGCQDLIKNGAGKAPGLNGPGSQNQGTPSQGFYTPSNNDAVASDPKNQPAKKGGASTVTASSLLVALAAGLLIFVV